MSKVCLIIGNGFDINLGLKTSYSDFIDHEKFKDLLQGGNEFARALKKKHKEGLWTDIELALGYYSKDCENLEKLKVEFTELKSLLTNFISESIPQIRESQASNLLGVFLESDIYPTILNFNYTRSVELVYRTYKSLWENKEIMHQSNGLPCSQYFVHGSIKDKDIIFGTSDNNKIPAKSSFLRKSSAINFGKVEVDKHLDKAELIIFFGHSIGETDSDYFKQFFTNTNGKEIHYYYYSDNGYDVMNERIYELSNKSTGKFKLRNSFKPIKVNLTNRDLRTLYKPYKKVN